MIAGVRDRRPGAQGDSRTRSGCAASRSSSPSSRGDLRRRGLVRALHARPAPVQRRKTVFAGGSTSRGSTLIQADLRAACTVQGPLPLRQPAAAGRFLVVEGRGSTGKVRFWEARFEGWAEFKDCTFAGEADFRSLHAEEGFVLHGCPFAGDALFRGATVCKKWDADRLAVRGAARPLEGQAPRLRLPRRDRAGRRPAVRVPQRAGRADPGPARAARRAARQRGGGRARRRRCRNTAC